MSGQLQTPEWRLAAEVLRQALVDAGGSPGQADLNIRDIDQARQFCLDRSGGWAEARLDWCDAAGVVPDAFTAAAQRSLAKPMASA
jgi:hypothetical protein